MSFLLQRWRRRKNDAPRSSDTTTPPLPLCEACWSGPFSAHYGLLSDRIRYTSRYDPSAGGFSYTTSWAAVTAQAQAGCKWCSLILASGGDDEEGEDGLVHVRVGSQGSLACYGTPEDSQDVTIFINGIPRMLGYAYAAADDPAAAHIVARSRVLDVGSPRTLALARAAIGECVHGHPDCIPPMSPAPRLPTRLIDCSNPHRPRLVATGGMQGMYVALSYVWGEDQPHKTTAARLSAYERAIKFTVLPQTIRDAIYVTHALGMRYLWVDSLCILQDSVEDQHREIRDMRHIYRDAYCTIIAASASRASEGFLHDRQPQVLSDVTIPFKCTHPTDINRGLDNVERIGAIHISHISTQNLHWSIRKPPPQYEPAMEPISARGWAMQEHLMSPRSLIFASHTLQFRCQTTTRNVGNAYHNRINEMRLPRALFLDEQPARRRPSWLGEIRRAWHDVVEDYTRRSITLPSDKLVACGGIAEEFQRVLGCDYLAGLWRDTLLVDLLWICRRATSPHAMGTTSRPPAYRAPSWSWAALDGHIYYTTPVPRSDTGKVRAFAEVVWCTVALEDATFPFGRVTDSSFLLCTPLIACEWDSKRIQVGEPSLLRISPSLVELKDRIAARHAKRGSNTPQENMDLIGHAHIDYQDAANIREVWAAPIFWDKKCWIQGLLVARVADQHNLGTEGVPTYRRIGLFDRINAFAPELHASMDTSWVAELPSVAIELV